jgi:uncharacterized protein (TIGR03067 family)
MPPRTRTALPLAVLLLLPAAVLRADDAPKGDKDLDGDWERVSTVRDGQNRPFADRTRQVMIIQGDAVTMTTGKVVQTGTLQIDSGKTPKVADFVPDFGPQKGMTLPGIYEVKGDELTFCRAEPGKDRPTELSSREGSGWTLITFKRVRK